ncbi:MAG: histidine kinase [Treponema sp.]|jgi:two-component system sensor histidine kinase YesM|nr:histidine kinase [Treponema sp.]
MKSAVFSRRLVLVYTVIVTVPLAMLTLVGTEHLRRGEYHRIITDAENDLKDNISHISNCIDLFMRIEITITGNRKMDDLFLFSNTSNKVSIVFQTRELSDELERFFVSMPQIYGIRIFTDDEMIPERWPIFFHKERLENNAYEQVLFMGEQKTRTWQYDYLSELMGTLEMGRNRSVSYITPILLHKRQIGRLQILMRVTDFFPFLYRERDAVQRTFVFQGTTPVASPEDGVEALPPRLSSRVLAAAAGAAAGRVSFRENGREQCFLWRKAPNTDLLLVRDCTQELNELGIGAFRVIAGIGILLSTALLFWIIRFATSRMMSRLYLIINSMNEVHKGNLDVMVPLEGNDEISGMAKAFTNMLARIKCLIQEIKTEERLVTETEIKAMQNQINAHFLYNVLETIRMQAELRDEKPIVQSITLLGKMLRYCLTLRKTRGKVLEELEYTRSYITLLNIRNDYVVALREHIEETALGLEIPRMLLQPIVENAFLYAIEPEGEDAVIDLRIETDPVKEMLLISVQDYGRGLEPEALKRLIKHIAGEDEKDTPGGIGLKNIQLRLTAFYGPSWKLDIKSAPEAGTLVRIPVPYTKEQ